MESTIQHDLADLAVAYLRGGLSLVPCSNETKRPDPRLLPLNEEGKPGWKCYQKRPADETTVRGWFRRGCRSVAVIGGAVSGGLLILDFDAEGILYAPWCEAVGNLADGLPVQRTGGGGYQVALRCPEPGENGKLAWVPDESEETGRTIGIETRAEGGYAVLPGSLHPFGTYYEAISGDWTNVPTVPQAQADALLAAARKLDQAPFTRQELERQRKAAEECRKHRAESNGQASVIDAYNEAVTIEAALAAYRYTRSGDRWIRPGGKSRTVYVDGGRSFHHSSDDPLNDGYWHRAFDLFAFYEHNGDCKQAVKAAAEKLGLKGKPTSPKAKPAAYSAGSFNLTDLGNAGRLVARHGDVIRYCHPWSKWLVWDGRRWAIDQTAEVERLAKQTVRAMLAEAAAEPDDTIRKALTRHAISSEASQRIQAMLRLAQSEPGVPVLPAELDRDPWLLNVENGVIDLRTLDLKPHSRDDMITKLAPVTFDPAATCPTWERAVTEAAAGRESLVGFRRRLAGYCLSGSVREHILAIFYGPGGNGKSTDLETVLALMGQDYAIKGAPEILLATKGSHPTERADLCGKRLVVCVETDGGRRLAESLVKELSGGDTIRARRMREDFWQFNPTHKIILATNHKPVVRGTDNGIWRRLKLVPFDACFIGREDRDMPEKLKAELPGILNWCLAGCVEWQDIGLGEPDEVRAATAEYRTEQDTVAAFVDEVCVTDETAKIRARDIYAAYRKWCEEAGEYVMNRTRFGLALTERGLRKQTSNGVWYVGIGLKLEQFT